MLGGCVEWCLSRCGILFGVVVKRGGCGGVDCFGHDVCSLYGSDSWGVENTYSETASSRLAFFDTSIAVTLILD